MEKRKIWRSMVLWRSVGELVEWVPAGKNKMEKYGEMQLSLSDPPLSDFLPIDPCSEADREHDFSI